VARQFADATQIAARVGLMALAPFDAAWHEAHAAKDTQEFVVSKSGRLL
jgi:hypothetical protein